MPSFLPHLFTLTLAASLANAQWTVTNLHPPGATESFGLGIGSTPSGIRQVGYATIAGAAHASLWTSSAASWIDLHPTGASFSIANAVSGTQQVGAAYANTVPFAATWSGTAASWQNLNPGQSSIANGISSGLIVGSFAQSPTSNASCQWLGGVRATLPSGIVATAVDASNRVGNIRTGSFPLFGTRAVLWSGPTFTEISLHPAGAQYSSAAGVSGNQQVGKATLGSMTGPIHASLWSGSAASWVDLNPANATGSECLAVSNGVQVGIARFVDPNDPNMNSIDRAAMWTGTAQSFVNLHALLTGFHTSAARGVYTDGATIHITGYGFNTATNRTEALLWTYTPAPTCGTSDFNGDGDFGTDADIEAFFACLAGNCCPTCFSGGADFNADGDTGTDADIEAFFRVLAGGNC